jgi:hypothetical protein
MKPLPTQAQIRVRLTFFNIALTVFGRTYVFAPSITLTFVEDER